MDFFITHWELISTIAMFILSEVIGALPIKSSGLISLVITAAKKALKKENPKDAVTTVKDEAVDMLKEKITAESRRFEKKVNAELERAIDRLFKTKKEK